MARDSDDRISPDELIQAYQLGYFPMARAREDTDIVWVLPDERGVIFLDDARMPKRMKRFIRADRFEIRINTSFERVIEECAMATDSRPDTWINDAIFETYCELHYRKRAHSVECWRNDRLVGGLYGVVLGAVFCGESMFSREPEASKVAMIHLMARLKIGGFHLIDAQFFNDHLVQFGLAGIPNRIYQERLRDALLCQPVDVFSKSFQFDTTRVLHALTQTS